MPSRSMVRRAARAVGMTVWPSRSSVRRVSVAMASISGTMKSGFSSSTTARSFSASSIGKTWRAWATCMAGASS